MCQTNQWTVSGVEIMWLSKLPSHYYKLLNQGVTDREMMMNSWEENCQWIQQSSPFKSCKQRPKITLFVCCLYLIRCRKASCWSLNERRKLYSLFEVSIESKVWSISNRVLMLSFSRKKLNKGSTVECKHRKCLQWWRCRNRCNICLGLYISFLPYSKGHKTQNFIKCNEGWSVI